MSRKAFSGCSAASNGECQKVTSAPREKAIGHAAMEGKPGQVGERDWFVSTRHRQGPWQGNKQDQTAFSLLLSAALKQRKSSMWSLSALSPGSMRHCSRDSTICLGSRDVRVPLREFKIVLRLWAKAALTTLRKCSSSSVRVG